MKRILGVDWGTSMLRTYLISDEGEIIGDANSDLGLKKAREYGFERALRETSGKLLDDVDAVVMCGMVGAREGWVEAPYIDCPSDANDVVKAMRKVPMDGLEAMIAPGLKHMREDMPDVMRGEETQVFGAMNQGTGDGVYVLPGTHSKWVKVVNGRINGFTTFMTGDVYQAIRSHTLFGMDQSDASELQEKVFREGVKKGSRTKSGGALLSLLFSARSLRLLGSLESKGVGSYLAGIVIGCEVAHELAEEGKAGGLVIIGNEDLTKKYAIACELLGIKATKAEGNIVVDGLRLYSSILFG